MVALAEGVTVDHIARQSKDIKRLADFYIETFGFEEVESPQVGPLKVIWLIKPSAFTMHLIECNPSNPPNQSNDDKAPVADPADIPSGHHICFSVSNFETFVQKLKEKGVETAHRPVEYNPTGSKKIDQVFFVVADGNGLEVSDSTAEKWVAPIRNAADEREARQSVQAACIVYPGRRSCNSSNSIGGRFMYLPLCLLWYSA